MRRLSGLPLLLVFTAAAALSCGSDSPGRPGDPLEARQLPAELQADAAELVAANNAFALDLYAKLRDRDGNLFCSPFSISTAFAMVQAGARTQTEAEIAQVFRFPLAQERLHTLFAALLQSLDTGASFEAYRLNIANRLWGQQGFPFLPAYLAVTRERYGAELQPMDFASDPEACRGVIKGWVAQKTEDRIKNLMPPGSISDMTRLVLTSAIYFKGTWKVQFDPAETRQMPFRVAPSRTVPADMMHLKDTVRLGLAGDLSVLELPYEGEDISMVVLLPGAADGLPALEGQLTPENLAAWMGTVRPREEIDVYLPRFEMTSFFSLSGTLAAMGMPSAFDPRAADFSGIDGQRDLFIQAAVHKAFVKVNEEGTEAAAATGISMGVTSMPPRFTADHPFLFLIRDNVTGSILFLGRVADPTVAE